MRFVGYSGKGDNEVAMFRLISPMHVLSALVPIVKYDFPKHLVRKDDGASYEFWFLEVTGGLARLLRNGTELYNIMG